MTKQNEQKKTNAFRPMNMMIGAILTLLITIFCFEYNFADPSLDEQVAKGTQEDDMETPPVTVITPPPPPKIQVPMIEIVEDEEEIEEDEEPIFQEAEEELVLEEVVEVVEEEEVEEIFMIVEQSAEPKGGMNGFRSHLAKYLASNYPERAKKAGIQGTVYINFYIDKNGAPKGFKVLKGIGGGCDEAAIDAIKAYGNWTPAEQRGKKVKQGFNIPVKFKIG